MSAVSYTHLDVYKRQAVDSMEQDFGFPLNLPPYPEYDAHVGRMSGMLPGLFENGGVYCHATGFKILMDCCTGRGEKALKTLKKIMPDSKENPSAKSGAEPYVFTNCYSCLLYTSAGGNGSCKEYRQVQGIFGPGYTKACFY